jgi:hypothetical protein
MNVITSKVAEPPPQQIKIRQIYYLQQKFCTSFYSSLPLPYLITSTMGPVSRNPESNRPAFGNTAFSRSVFSRTVGQYLAGQYLKTQYSVGQYLVS